jgi:putative transposase
MPRKGRGLRGDVAYHVVNRGYEGRTLFHTVGDYHVFHRTLAQALKRFPVALHAHAVLPDRWHLVIRSKDGQGETISLFMHWLTVTHCHRWRARRGGIAGGRIYHDRYQAEAVPAGVTGLALMERLQNAPVKANLVREPEQWPWCSAGQGIMPESDRVPVEALPATALT